MKRSIGICFFIFKTPLLLTQVRHCGSYKRIVLYTRILFISLYKRKATHVHTQKSLVMCSLLDFFHYIRLMVPLKKDSSCFIKNPARLYN